MNVPYSIYQRIECSMCIESPICPKREAAVNAPASDGPSIDGRIFEKVT